MSELTHKSETGDEIITPGSSRSESQLIRAIENLLKTGPVHVTWAVELAEPQKRNAPEDIRGVSVSGGRRSTT